LVDGPSVLFFGFLVALPHHSEVLKHMLS
jgi:hypothetical protein